MLFTLCGRMSTPCSGLEPDEIYCAPQNPSFVWELDQVSFHLVSSIVAAVIYSGLIKAFPELS